MPVKPFWIWLQCFFVACVNMARPSDPGIRKMQEARSDAKTASGHLRMSSSGARRSRAGSTKGDIEDKKDTADEKTINFLIPKPDGRVCKTCHRKDNDEDPVYKAMGRLGPDGKALFMWWAYSPWPNGLTRGDQCYYCVRLYLREGKVVGMTLKDWQADIGSRGPTGLQGHEMKVLPTF